MEVLDMAGDDVIDARPGQAVRELDTLEPDPEASHLEAERIVCRFLAAAGYGRVADAFWRAKARCGFWYA